MMQALPFPGPKHAPIDRAHRYYLAHGRTNFFDDLADHLRSGIVVARPTCFFMAKMLWLEVKEGEPLELAWFVHFYTGSARELITCFPWPLKWIAFCRRDKPKVHKRRFARYVGLAFNLKRREEGEEIT